VIITCLTVDYSEWLGRFRQFGCQSTPPEYKTYQNFSLDDKHKKITHIFTVHFKCCSLFATAHCHYHLCYCVYHFWPPDNCPHLTLDPMFDHCARYKYFCCVVLYRITSSS